MIHHDIWLHADISFSRTETTFQHKPLLSAAARRTSLHHGASPMTVFPWYSIACPQCLQLGPTPSHAHTKRAYHAGRGRFDATLARAISLLASAAGVNHETAIFLRSDHGRVKRQAEGRPAVQVQLLGPRCLYWRTQRHEIIDKHQPQSCQSRRIVYLAQVWRTRSSERQSIAGTMHWGSCSVMSDLATPWQEMNHLARMMKIRPP
jgi:hypothetical protein